MADGMSVAANSPLPERRGGQQTARVGVAERKRALRISPSILSRIGEHEDLAALELTDLPTLAEEIREQMIEVVCSTGGHLGSNFGVVELTIALHQVFDFAKDALVMDVGHQCYPHKLLTGRSSRFHTLRSKNGISGYPHPAESRTDVMRSGHAGTSISVALGIAAGAGMFSDDRRVVCLVGDSALAAGVAQEGLNYADHLGRNLLVVLNDNEMSISKTVGSLASYLSRLRAAPLYTGAKDRLRALLRSMPFGEQLDKNLVDMVDAVKAAIAPGHLFEELGFRYYGPIDGHDIKGLIETLNTVKDLPGVTLLHAVTKKGKGLERTGKDTRYLHAVSPGARLPGYGAEDEVAPKAEATPAARSAANFTQVFGEVICDAAERDPRVVAITAAMPEGTGLTRFAERFPQRFHDTGITEQHAVAFAGGLAKAGARPVCAIYSTFLQRAYDQLFQEAVLQDLPVMFCLDRGGLVGQDGPSHHGCYDIAYARTFPHVVLCSPRDASELRAMFDLGLKLEHPFVMRYPRANCADPERPSTPLELGKSELLREGSDATLVGYGSLVYTALEAAEVLAGRGLDVAVINARFCKPLDGDLLFEYAGKTGLLFTLEEHQLTGGFGSAVLEEFARRGRYADRVVPMGIPDRMIEHASRRECLEDAGLTVERLVRQVLERSSLR